MAHDTGPTVTVDEHFGDVSVSLDSEEGELTVTGEQIPQVALARTPDTEADPHIPIGTRDASLLSLTVDGGSVAVTPAKGRLTRRSYRVDVNYSGASYRLVPDSITGSRLLKDGRQIGDFSSDGDGQVLAEWKDDENVLPADAAVGYALAAAFGTGGQPMWMLVVDAIGDMIPG